MCFLWRVFLDERTLGKDTQAWNLMTILNYIGNKYRSQPQICVMPIVPTWHIIERHKRQSVLFFYFRSKLCHRNCITSCLDECSRLPWSLWITGVLLEICKVLLSLFLASSSEQGKEICSSQILEHLRQSQGLKSALFSKVISNAIITCRPLVLEVELMSEFKSSCA